MSVTRRSVRGMAWAATSGWMQLGIGVCTFGVVTRNLSASEIGSFGVVSLLIGIVEMTTCAPFGEGLQQRRSLEPEHVHATFWVGLMLAFAAAILLEVGAGTIAEAFSSPASASLLAWAALALPLGPATTVPGALLARALRFDELARIDILAGALSACVLLGAVFSGAGIWSLLLGDLAGRVVRLGLLWRASNYRPGSPRHLGAITDLMRFNLSIVGTYLLGYGDRVAPNLLTGFLLGAAPLGTLIVAQRVLDLLHQLVLGPLNSVTMAAVARLQTDGAELRRLILSLYRMAAFVGYPAFLGAIVLTPELARLMGDKWLSAVPAIQVLLLVGLRTTTGMFNLPILRGLGHTIWPLGLLGAGLMLNLLFVPLGSIHGTMGIAAAVLARTLATWPIGCAMVRRATGISFRDQAVAGRNSIVAAVLMALGTAGVLAVLPAGPPLTRLACGALFGALLYLGLLATMAPATSRALASAASSLLRGDRTIALVRLRAGLGM